MSVKSGQPYSLLKGRLLRLLAVAIAVGPVLLVISQLSIGLGQHLPVRDISADYLLAVIVAAVLGLLIFLWPLNDRERVVCVALWVVKIFLCLVVMLWYENRYDFLDAYSYFRESLDHPNDFVAFSMGSGTNVVVALVSGLWTLFPESYHAAKIVFAYVGLISFVFFARTFQIITGRDSVLFLLTLGLIPSMMFWSSILGKDPIILFAISITTYSVACYGDRAQKGTSILLYVSGLMLAALVRPWIAGILVFASFVVVIGRVSLSRFGVVFGILFVCVIILTLVGVLINVVDFQLVALLALLEQLSSGWAVGGSAINSPVVFSSWWDVVSFFPIGVFTALYRPLPGEVGNIFGLLAGIENVVLLVLTIWVLTRVRGGRSSQSDARMSAWLGLCIVLWVGMYAFLSYQNLGTAVRFRAQILPIAFLLAWSFVSKKKRLFEDR